MKPISLIILGGFAGAGKTTVAKKLSADFNVPLVSTDELNDALRQASGQDFHTVSPMAHDTAWALLESYVQNGVTAVFDANMCHERTWRNVDALKQRWPELAVIPMILECSLETHKARIERRGRENTAHLNLGGDAFEKILHKYEYITNLQRPDLIRINADQTFEAVYREVLHALRDTLDALQRTRHASVLTTPVF